MNSKSYEAMHNNYFQLLEKNLAFLEIFTLWNSLFIDYLFPWKISQAEEQLRQLISVIKQLLDPVMFKFQLCDFY